MASRSGRLPTELMGELTLTEIQLNARVYQAARRERVALVNRIITQNGDDPFKLITALLAELVVRA